MMQLTGRASFAHDPFDVFGVQFFFARNLDRDLAIQCGIFGQPDIAELAAAQMFDDPEPTYRFDGLLAERSGLIRIEDADAAATTGASHIICRHLVNDVDPVMAMRTLDPHANDLRSTANATLNAES
jgi:hypothetical protein